MIATHLFLERLSCTTTLYRMQAGTGVFTSDEWLQLDCRAFSSNAIYLKDFYLNTPMDRPEYMQMKMVSELPLKFVELYNLNKLADHNGTIYVKVQKGMYGLLQAGILVHQLLEERLNEYGYEQSKICLGLWKPISQPISFTLCVDNF